MSCSACTVSIFDGAAVASYSWSVWFSATDVVQDVGFTTKDSAVAAAQNAAQGRIPTYSAVWSVDASGQVVGVVWKQGVAPEYVPLALRFTTWVMPKWAPWAAVGVAGAVVWSIAHFWRRGK